MRERRGEVHLHSERTTVSIILYVFGVAFVCAVSWITVHLRFLSTYTDWAGDASLHEMLNFGERSLRFAFFPHPKQGSSETEAGINQFPQRLSFKTL